MRGTTIRTTMLVAALASSAAWAGKYPELKVATPPVTHATARVEALSPGGPVGRAVFTIVGQEVRLEVTLEGLAPGTHAIHLHERGDCSAPDGSSAGPHWNPTGEPHGRWMAGKFHHGDVGNVVAGADGRASLTLSTNLWRIGDGSPADVVGRSIVVHERPDDFTSQPAGNSGGRIACGVIRPND